MLPRSTACRHGLGRTSANAESISSSRPSRTSRFAGLMSRWARPASHSCRTICRPWSISASSTSTSPTSWASGEELGDQQVLPLRGDLDEPVRLRDGQPGRVHQPQHVVLVLDQPAHGVERLLVLQPAVEQRAAELVPPVRAEVGDRVQLAEQVRLRVALDRHPQRRRTARALQPEGLDRRHHARPAGRAARARSPRRGARSRRGGPSARAGSVTGKTSLGTSRRQPASGIATPMATPTRMSVGWSMAR